MQHLIRIILGLLLVSPLLAQSPEKANSLHTYSTDSLVAKRGFMTTVLLKDNKRVPGTEMRNLLQSTPRAIQAYRWGNILKPVGPVLIVAGLAAGYLGIKGQKRTAFIRGVSTKTDPYPNEVEVAYTKRNVPAFLAGVGLFVAGLYFIERSNELTATSVRLYNAKPAPIRTLSHIDYLNFGITSTGNLGLEAQF